MLGALFNDQKLQYASLSCLNMAAA